MSDRQRPPNKRPSVAFEFEHEGHRYRASISRFDSGELAEIFLDTGKVNSPKQTHAETSAILVSLLLQHGVAVDVIRHSIAGPIAVALDMVDGEPAAAALDQGEGPAA